MRTTRMTIAGIPIPDSAARAFLERHGLPEDRVMTVWESIALHTTPEVHEHREVAPCKPSPFETAPPVSVDSPPGKTIIRVTGD